MADKNGQIEKEERGNKEQKQRTDTKNEAKKIKSFIFTRIGREKPNNAITILKEKAEIINSHYGRDPVIFSPRHIRSLKSTTTKNEKKVHNFWKIVSQGILDIFLGFKLVSQKQL